LARRIEDTPAVAAAAARAEAAEDAWLPQPRPLPQEQRVSAFRIEKREF